MCSVSIPDGDRLSSGAKINVRRVLSNISCYFQLNIHYLAVMRNFIIQNTVSSYRVAIRYLSVASLQRNMKPRQVQRGWFGTYRRKDRWIWHKKWQEKQLLITESFCRSWQSFSWPKHPYDVIEPKIPFLYISSLDSVLRQLNKPHFRLLLLKSHNVLMLYFVTCKCLWWRASCFPSLIWRTT
jgi:hypothetical protein